MSNANSKKLWTRILVVVAILVVAGLLGFKYWRARQSALPEGIVSGNGRIESKLVDVAAKEPLRVKEILVNEGDTVEPNQVVVRLDTTTLNAELAEAKAKVAAARERVAIAKAAIVKAKSEIELAKIEVERARKLLQEHAASQREYDVRQTVLQTSTAGLAEQEARLQTAQEEVKVAQESVAVIQTRINDATLRSPVRGRVLYRLAEVGEVLAAGGKALTLVNLNDIYMEIFLPALEAARVKIGDEARITLDDAPGRAAAGYVSFVSPEAQFTPKQVETRSERTKLMFRVKIQLPEELVASYIEYIKTGVRGVGYVRLDQYAVWPERLQNLVTPLKEPERTVPAGYRRKEVF
jgi:HlyD family secretion protein